jgi:hypothetical protein
MSNLGFTKGFSEILGFRSLSRTMAKVRKPNISESYTPSSESYSNYLYQRMLVRVKNFIIYKTENRNRIRLQE